jgi:hypothetical protein
MIGIIFTLYRQFGTTGNYSAITDFRTLQFTVTRALGFSAFTSILATDITVSLSLQVTHEVFFSRSNCFLAIIVQLPTPKSRIHSIPLLPSSYTCPAKLVSRNSTRLRPLKVKVKVTLRLTVSQSVSKSWYRAPSGTHDQIFITV